MSSPRHWWANGPRGLSTRAKAGTGVVAFSLAAVTAAVWTSPSTPTTTSPPSVTTEADRLREEIAALEAQLADRVKGGDHLPQAPLAPSDEPEPELQTEPPADEGGGGSGGRAGGPDDDGTGPANPTRPTQPAGRGPAVVDPVTAPPRSDLLSPSQRYYGMYTVQSPFSWATLDDVATKTGVLPNLAGYFSGWDKPFRADAVTRSWQRGMLPMLTWESRPSSAANNQRDQADYSLPRIIDGAFDDYLRQYARDVAATGLPIAIRLDHEMNGDWYPWSEVDKSGESINSNTPGDYVRMWRHVHDIFEAEGANAYVIWVWAPNIVNNLPEPLRDPANLERLYPGDEYVDWVGLSGYYRPPFRSDQTPTFAYTFDRSLDQLRALTERPILLAEIGASEVGGQKPRWVRDFFDGLTDPANADVIGFAWFNLTVTTIVGGERVTNDWRVDSRRDSLEAFARGLSNPGARMGGTPYPPGAAPEPPPAPMPSQTPAASPTQTPAATPTQTPTPSATPTASPDPTPTPSAEPGGDS
jgi:hypothetical protein